MVQFEPINFGVLIAFILPGSVAVYGLRYVSPRISALWGMLETGQLIIGPLILLALLTLAVGLIVSSLRTVVLERIFYLTCVQEQKINYKEIADHKDFFKEMIENVYRYEQFYGNVFLALLFCSIMRYFVGNANFTQTKSDWVISAVLLGSLITLFLAGRKSLKDVSRAIQELSH
jgi:hypothetical protein